MDHRWFPPLSNTRTPVLDSALWEILFSIKPSEEDRTRRYNVINGFRGLVSSIESLRDATIHPFGSFVSNLYSKWGDLDISIELSSSFVSSVGKGCKQKLLRDIQNTLRLRGGVHKIQFIPHARVPLLKFQSCYPDISCDISIGNLVGQTKSKIMFWITEIDERFRDMVLLVCWTFIVIVSLCAWVFVVTFYFLLQIKEWAKAQNINDPKSGTLNSYSLSLLVIFHFQTCNPPILPPLKEIYGGNIIDDLTGMRSLVERRIQEVCIANITRFKSLAYRLGNRSSLADIFISFFEKFSRIHVVSANFAICTFTGQWEPIASHAKWMEKNYRLFIEDPFEQPENAARAVGANQLGRISEAFQRTYSMLSSKTALSDRRSLIASLAKPSTGSTLGIRTQNSQSYTQGNFGRYLQSANGPTSQVDNQHALRLENRPMPTFPVQLRPSGVRTLAQQKQGWRPRN